MRLLFRHRPGPPRSREALRALLVAAVLACVAVPVRGEDVPEVPLAEAGLHVGQVARVCGRVETAAHIPSAKGRPTFLNLGRPYPDQLFTIVIWEQARSRFEEPPERFFDGKEVCVTGRIETYRGKPQIVVSGPEQIVVTPPVDAGVALSGAESVFIKALLSALGYEANYGTPAWDQEGIDALVSFQEASGIEPSGEPDAATLRALAQEVARMPEAERTMVIRLFLLELARRQG